MDEGGGRRVEASRPLMLMLCDAVANVVSIN